VFIVWMEDARNPVVYTPRQLVRSFAVTLVQSFPGAAIYSVSSTRM
jgi:hypothetical protein